MPNLQPLFRDPVLKQTLLGGVASEVWLVQTKSGEFIVRSSQVDGNTDAAFVWVCRHMFGIELKNTFRMEHVNQLLSKISDLSIPKVLNKAMLDGKPYLVVEKIDGANFNLHNKSVQMMEAFGKSMASIHSYGENHWGPPFGATHYPLADFPSKLKLAIQNLTLRYHHDNDELKAKAEEYSSKAGNLPTPKSATYIMLDMDPRQFLTDGHRVSALVDTEAYVLGPCELDLVALECCMDGQGALAFHKGYSSVRPFPDLTPFRDVYRFLFCLMEIKGPSVSYQDWVSKKQWFC